MSDLALLYASGYRGAAAIALKAPDWQGVYLCSGCHSFVDGGWTRSHSSKEEMLIMFYEAIFRTQDLLVEQGLLTAKE